MESNYKMVATTLFGLEEVLADELKKLGAQSVTPGVRSVSFVGDKGFMYKANMSLRTAIRILKPIRSFSARDEHEMYDKLKTIYWDRLISPTGSFAISAVSNSRNFTDNTHYIALKSKDAIVDFFRDKYGDRPNIDLKHPDLRIHIHVENLVCTVSLDSSGESLHKRGYRDRTNLAPINEVLAAGLVLLSGYKGNTHFIDPMCGSGTILIEAAMIAANIPANINRPEFGFEKWEDFDAELMEVIHAALMTKIQNPNYKIMGYDKAPSAVEKAKENIAYANLSEFIKVYQINFFESEKQLEGPTQLLFNPPYGERLELENIDEFYKQIGDTLKQKYPDTQAWFITSDLDALKHVGLRTSRKIPMKNAGLDCKFVKYEMYAGTKKMKFKDTDNATKS